MSSPDRRVIALGNLAGELKAALEAAVRAADVELLLTREPARAFVELERDGALAVLVDMATLGAEQFCKRARGTERLRSVPVIGMSRHPNELGFARVFAWGADDLVPLGAVKPLERRLLALRGTEQSDATSFGRAVVAEATTQRRALVGRVLAQAGYEVKFAVDRGAVELYASQAETRLVVISAALGDPRRIIEAAARAGALPTWIITAEARSVARLASSLSGLDRVAVTSTSGSPEDVLFLANELVFGKGVRRREWRALYATPVAFRTEGSDADEYGFSYDASPGGLYVRSLLPCETDAVEVELRLPNRDERVRLNGKIVRRFAFGSGAIASAPPGFSVRLEGPDAELERWADACQQLILSASDAMTNPPPGALAEGDADKLTSTETALAVPPATLTIESVVAPLPTSVLEDVEKGSDVGELLAATLDEQTLVPVGTKPVTMDADTLDVREERPSEFAIRVPSEPPISLAPDTLPRPAAGRLPLPTPVSSTANEIPEPQAPAPEAPRETAEYPPAPKPVDLHDWESDAQTAVRRSRPDMEAPPASAPVAASPAPTELAPTERAPHEPEKLDSVEPLPLEPSLLLEAVPSDAPDFAATAYAQPAFAAARPVEPPVAAPVEPPAPPLRRAGRSTMIGVAPPAPRLPEAGFAKTQPLPPARAKAPSSPKLEMPFAKTLVSTAPGGGAAVEAAPTPPVTPVAAPVTTAAPVSQPAYRASSPELEIAPPPPAPAAANPVVLATAPNFATAQTLSAVVPDTAPHLRKAAAPNKSGGGRTLVALGAVAAALIGGGLAILLPKNEARRTVDSPPPSETTAATASAEPPAEPAPAPAPPALTTTAASTAIPAATTTATSVASAAAPEPAASIAPSTSVTPAESPAPPSATPPAPLPPAPAVHAPVEFDVTKLNADRAALYVHSSVTAHVFVHGVDYGETNQVLVTSCGTRFVRLGRALGDFAEPGRSYVIKCGKLTELTIEPAP